ncbi:hypothetical protein BJ912DRAFT_926342 [Pholiota molesta]|nr:hypothetical protein BJ912DRAFT_926342 [Pholiota molesta]
MNRCTTTFLMKTAPSPSDVARVALLIQKRSDVVTYAFSAKRTSNHPFNGDSLERIKKRHRTCMEDTVQQCIPRGANEACMYKSPPGERHQHGDMVEVGEQRYRVTKIQKTRTTSPWLNAKTIQKMGPSVLECGAGPAIEEALVEASGGVIIVSEPANGSSLRELSEEVNNTRGHPERRVRLIEHFGYRQIVRVLNEDQLQTAKLPNIDSDGSITYTGPYPLHDKYPHPFPRVLPHENLKDSRRAEFSSTSIHLVYAASRLASSANDTPLLLLPPLPTPPMSSATCTISDGYSRIIGRTAAVATLPFPCLGLSHCMRDARSDTGSVNDSILRIKLDTSARCTWCASRIYAAPDLATRLYGIGAWAGCGIDDADRDHDADSEDSDDVDCGGDNEDDDGDGAVL